MAGPLGEAANGYRVYQQNQKKKTTPVAGPTHTYEDPREVQRGYANQDLTYADNVTAQQKVFHAREALGLIDQYGRPLGTVPAARSDGSYGGGGGGGRGGGGSAGPQPAYDPALLDQLLASLQGQYDTNVGKSKAAYATYDKGLNDAYQKDLGASQAAFAALDQSLAGLGNPYASIGPAAAAQVQPDKLANLIRSQGGNDAGLRAQAEFLQAQNGASASAADRLAQLLGAAQLSWNQGTQSAAKQAAAQNQGDLLSRLAAMRTAAATGQSNKESDLLAALQAAQQGVMLKKAEMR